MKPAYHAREDQICGYAVSLAKEMKYAGANPEKALAVIKENVDKMTALHITALMNNVHQKHSKVVAGRAMKAARRILLTS